MKDNLEPFVVEIGDFKQTYQIFLTDAPEDYDGFGTFTVATSRIGDTTKRIVLVNEQHVEWQTDRYLSGRHTVDRTGMDSASIRRILVERLKTGSVKS